MKTIKHQWRECAEAEATYWRVTCHGCGFSGVKASRRNVQLHVRGHIKAKRCDKPSFTVTPLKRVELVSA
jgi:hypothetical protein